MNGRLVGDSLTPRNRMLMRRPSAITALILLSAFTVLIDAQGPFSLGLLSPALAKNDKGTNGNGNGGPNGSKAVKNADTEDSSGTGDDGGSQSIGDDFRNEGFAAIGSGAASGRDKGKDGASHDDARGSNDADFTAPKHTGNWKDDIGLGHQFNLDFIKNGANSLAKELDSAPEAGHPDKDDNGRHLGQSDDHHAASAKAAKDHVPNGKAVGQNRAVDDVSGEGRSAAGPQPENARAPKRITRRSISVSPFTSAPMCRRRSSRLALALPASSAFVRWASRSVPPQRMAD
jgi:hypothetical protein